jgi:hypothetical protein
MSSFKLSSIFDNELDLFETGEGNLIMDNGDE